MSRLARLLRCTEGQAYSAAIVAVVATVMVVAGVPAALRGRPLAPAATASAAPSATTTSIAIPRFGEAPSPVVGGTPDVGGPAAEEIDRPGSPSGRATEPARVGTTTTFVTVGAPGAPHGIAVAPDGNVYVATNNGTARGRSGPSAVIAHRPDGTVARRYSVTGQPDGHADGLTGLALDGRGGIIALDAATGRVLRFDLGSGREETLATVPDIPACVPVATSACEPGVQDHPVRVHAVVVDGGRLLVSDTGQATIWQVDPKDGSVRPWYQSLDLAAGDGPAGLVLTAGRHVLFSAGTTLDVDALGAGAVYELEVTPAGAAGKRVLRTSFGRGDQPDGMAVGASGRTYVALRGADALVVVGADGVEERRITQSLDAPVAIAFRGRSLLVTNQSHTDRWSVLDVAVDDRPAS